MGKTIVRAFLFSLLGSAFGALANTSTTCSEDYISRLPDSSSNATISQVTLVPANGTFGGGSADLEFPTNDTGLPALCAVTINVPSSARSSYNFGLFLPEVSSWNERFIASGNGGFAGGINWNDMGTNVHYGFASMSTDTGHISGAGDGSWALNNPEAQTDWGYRAMHGSVVLAKEVVEKYYGKSIAYAYYSGCSTGGRQGLKEVEMFPEDFDGVLAGAPAWWTTHLQTWTVKVGLYNLPNNGTNHIPAELFPVISAEVFRQCDAQDGIVDGIISDPYGCNFYPEALLCSLETNTNTSNVSACLTDAQIDTLYQIYNDWVDTNQTFVFPHLALGSEAQWPSLLDTSRTNAPSPLGTAWVADFLLSDPNWDYNNFSYATVQLADAVNPGMANADDFDLAPFHARGGKLLHYHGLSDALIATGSSMYFYKQVLKRMATQGVGLDDWYRFFLVPGMQHCANSVNNAPWYFAGAGQPFGLGSSVYSVPGFSDSKHDILLALMAWTEQGTAPDSIVATKYTNDSVEAPVVRQRPLCPYPSQAQYKGSGDLDNAESWECRNLYHMRYY